MLDWSFRPGLNLVRLALLVSIHVACCGVGATSDHDLGRSDVSEGWLICQVLTQFSDHGCPLVLWPVLFGMRLEIYER